MTALLWLYLGLSIGWVIGIQMGADAAKASESEPAEAKGDGELWTASVGGVPMYRTTQQDSGAPMQKAVGAGVGAGA